MLLRLAASLEVSLTVTPEDRDHGAVVPLSAPRGCNVAGDAFDGTGLTAPIACANGSSPEASTRSATSGVGVAARI